MTSKNSSRLTCRPSTTRHSVSGVDSSRPDGPPQPGPEDRRDHDGGGRQAGEVAEDQRLDELARDGLGDEVERHHLQHRRPARVDRGGQRGRQDRGDHRPDIGHEAQHRRGHAPQRRGGHADEVEAHGRHHAEGGVDGELGQVVAAEAVPGVVQRHGGALQVVGAEQPDHAVAQVLALHQHEDRHDEDDEQRRERAQHRLQHRLGQLHRRGRRRLHLHELRLGGVGRGLGPRGLGRRACRSPVEPLRQAAQAAHRHAPGRRTPCA